MSGPWQVRVYVHERLVYTTTCTPPVELGRQADEKEAKPYAAVTTSGRSRIIVARLDESSASRRHALVDSLPDGRARLTNLSKTLPIRLLDGAALGPDATRELSLPLVLRIGQRVVRIELPTEEEVPLQLQSLSERPLPPGLGGASLSPRDMGSLAGATVALRAAAVLESSATMSSEALVRWLHAAMGVLHSAAGSTDFLDRAAGVLVDMIGLDAGWVLRLDQGQWQVQAHRTAPHRANHDWQPSRQMLAKLLEERRTFWQAPTAAEQSLAQLNAVIAAPILDPEGAVIGALYGDRAQTGAALIASAGEPISRLEATLVELLAGGVAAGLARLELQQAAIEGQKRILRFERDLEIGREIQAGFLPDEVPQPPGWEVVAYFRPAREVSGDFYDVFALPDDHLALVVADVCDKGVGAALYMTLLRSLIRAFAQQTLGLGALRWPGAPGEGGDGPGGGTDAAAAARRRTELLTKLTALSTVELTNNYVAVTHAKAVMFATMFFGILDTHTGVLTYVNAGHDTPVVQGPAGVKARLSITGPVVGITPNVAFELGRVVLEPGDTLFAYTDGVTEARNPAGQQFTEQRLLSVLAEPPRPPAELLDAVVTRLREHVAGAEPSDDVTMLAVRRAR
jgi:sigma-B regulation protein RsbU (phosphoserine phosphatase)